MRFAHVNKERVEANKCLPRDWLNSAVPVIFDFGSRESLADKKGRRNSLCCLFPGRFGNHGKIAAFSREVFIDSVISGEWSAGVRRVLDSLPPVEPPREETSHQVKEPTVTQRGVMRIKRRRPPEIYDHVNGKLIRRRRF